MLGAALDPFLQAYQADQAALLKEACLQSSTAHAQISVAN